MGILRKIKKRAKFLNAEVLAIYYSMKDARTPWLARIMVGLTVSYAYSPIDLIPDFIPFIGYLDDLLILPLMIKICIRLIPKEVFEECRIKAQKSIAVSKKIGIYTAIVIALLWIGLIAFIISKVV